MNAAAGEEDFMSLINGPKKIVVKPPTPNSSSVASMVGAGGVAMFQNLTGIRFDPAPAYLFFVEISGLVVALFTECSGIGAVRAVEKISEGGLNDHVHVLPGKVEHQNITLKRGLSISRELWNWFGTGIYDFKVKKLNISITQGAPGHSALSPLTDSGYGIVKRWNIEKAFPVSWKLSDLNTSSQETVAIESVELAHSGISLDLIAGTPLSPAGAITDILS
jgi:phage tail-like protein